MDKKQKFCDLLGSWVESSSVPCLVARSCPTVCNPTDWSLPGSSVHGDSPGKNIGVGCHAFLQGIFPTQKLNPGLPHCRQILYHLSHQGSPKILESVAYPFAKESSQPRNQTGVSCIAGGFFTNWAIREAPAHSRGWTNVQLNYHYSCCNLAPHTGFHKG